MSETATIAKIRDILWANARLGIDPRGLASDVDLYEAGMSSSSNLTVLFTLEEEFGIEFPEHMLGRETFKDISSIHAAVSKLLDEAGHTSAQSG